jgi:hypothetical protein
MTSIEELQARVLDEVERRGGMDAVLGSLSGPGECTATALFSVRDEFTDEQFGLVFALGQHALMALVFDVIGRPVVKE